MDCVFCEIVAGRAPANVVARSAHSLIIVPLGPVNTSHVLVIPRVHAADAATDPAVTAQTMNDAALYAATQGRPFNLITSAGREATQSVFHLHVHYIARAADDGLMVPWGTLHGERPQDPHRCRRLVALEEASGELVRHVDDMADRWADMGATASGRDARNRELWAPLHTKADRVQALLGDRGARG